VRGQLARRNADEQVEVQAVDLEPNLRGYHVAWNYGTRYWLPLLGPLPWAVWQTLLSFCFGGRDTCWPSIEHLADIAAGGNRHLITGRWRGKGESRRRQPGALEILEEAGLLAVETQHAGRQTRYRFHVLREPPILAPDQLAQLPQRLQDTHAELLARCGMDQQTYQQLAHRVHRRAAQDTTPYVQDTTRCAQGITPSAQDTTNNYKEEILREELWRTIKEALKLEISPANYQTYLEDTRGIAFDRNTGTLVVEASSPLAASQLNNYFQMTVRRAIAAVDFVPRAQDPEYPRDRVVHDLKD
jgi:hypothetical protein